MQTDANPVAIAPLMLTAADVARELGLSLRTVRRLDEAGKLPQPRRFGRAVRWPRAELLDWVNAGCPPRDEWRWKPQCH